MIKTFTHSLIKKLFLSGLTVVFAVCWAFGQAPVITSFSPASGPAGTSVTIIGSGFNITAAKNIVFFGATLAKVSAATT